jgi:hypothetical protein
MNKAFKYPDIKTRIEKLDYTKANSSQQLEENNYNLASVTTETNAYTSSKIDAYDQYLNSIKNDTTHTVKLEEIESANVNHPKYYTTHPSGIECIEIARHYCFSIGNAIKYLWRAGLKKDASLDDKQKEIEDLEKAIWYINDRIKQLKYGNKD